jgi:hypothetical protein
MKVNYTKSLHTCIFLYVHYIFLHKTTNTVKAKNYYRENQSVVTLTGTAENLSEVVQSFSYKLSL